jgi:acyl-CoA thioesterase FadM
MPVTFPDILTIGSRVEEDTNSDSAWFHHYAIVSHKTGRVVAEVEAKMVNYDYTAQKRTPFSPQMHQKLFSKTK